VTHDVEVTGEGYQWDARCSCGWVCLNLATKAKAEAETVAHTVEPLTQEEVDELPEGAEVVITWSGGNGPWRYTIAVDRNGCRMAKEANAYIDFVGPERPFTVVRRAA
jgi:hypothetical protein